VLRAAEAQVPTGLDLRPRSLALNGLPHAAGMIARPGTACGSALARLRCTPTVLWPKAAGA